MTAKTASKKPAAPVAKVSKKEAAQKRLAKTAPAPEPKAATLYCPKCPKDMTGSGRPLVSGKCPGCGWTATKPAPTNTVVSVRTGKVMAKTDSKTGKLVKPAPTPAAKPETKAASKKERAETIPGEAKIKVLFKDNPARPGTTAWKVRELYRTCKTAGEWRERVAASDLDPGYLTKDVHVRKLIAVE